MRRTGRQHSQSTKHMLGGILVNTDVLQHVHSPSANAGNRRQPTTKAKPNLKATDTHHYATKRAATQPVDEQELGAAISKTDALRQVHSHSATKNQRHPTTKAKPSLKATDPHHCATTRAATQPIDEKGRGPHLFKTEVLQQVHHQGEAPPEGNRPPPLCDEKGGNTINR